MANTHRRVPVLLQLVVCVCWSLGLGWAMHGNTALAQKGAPEPLTPPLVLSPLLIPPLAVGVLPPAILAAPAVNVAALKTVTDYTARVQSLPLEKLPPLGVLSPSIDIAALTDVDWIPLLQRLTGTGDKKGTQLAADRPKPLFFYNQSTYPAELIVHVHIPKTGATYIYDPCTVSYHII
jgi:hypothetical protein